MTDENTTKQISERSLVEAKINLDTAVSRWVESQGLDATNKVVASEQLHSAVLGLWWKMRYHLRKTDAWDDYDSWVGDDDEEESETEYVIWQGIHPSTQQPVIIRDLRDMQGWMYKTGPISESSSGPNSSGQNNSTYRRIRLPAEAALTVAQLLIELFHEFGWGVERKGGLPGEEGFDPVGDSVSEKKTKELMES